MALLTVSSLITDQFISALCNTLVHSLWQGVLLAAVTGLIIIFTRKASASFRYNFLIAALVVFAIGVGITFTTQFKAEQNNTATLQNVVTESLTFTTAGIPTVDLNTGKTGFEYTLKSYLNNNHNTIVLIWFLIICARSIQLGLGLWGIRRMKHSQVTVNAYWAGRMQQLADSLAIKQGVALFESALAKVPMVIGNLKPVILMPVGLLAALSTAEVEAILVHELAHIKRRDYLVNLLQSLMEIVFFFNPAVLWVSQLIKTERENCCDDLAIAQSSSKVNYIRALVSCEEYQAAVPAYAMAFPGSKNSLVDRVKRIAANRNHSLNLFEKTALAVCLVASGLFFTAFTEQERIQNMADKIVAVIDNIKQEASVADKNAEAVVAKKDKPATVSNITPADKADDVDFNDTTNVYPTNLTLSGTPDLSYNNNVHLNLMSACLPPLGVQLAALTAKKSIKVVGAADSSKYIYKYDAKNNQWIDTKRIDEYVDDTYKVDTAKRYNVNSKISVNSNANVNYKTNIKLNINVDTSKYYNTYKADYKPYLRRNYAVDSTKKYLAGLGNIKTNLHIPKIAELLYDAGLIKDKANFSAFISNDALVVNGETQPENIHRQILKKFQKKPGDNVNLSYTYGTPPGRVVPVR